MLILCIQVATCLDSVTIQLCEKEAELVGLRGRVGVDLDCVHDDVRGRVGHLDRVHDDDQYVMIRINLCDEILDHCWLVFMVISCFFMFLYDFLFNGFLGLMTTMIMMLLIPGGSTRGAACPTAPSSSQAGS